MTSCRSYCNVTLSVEDDLVFLPVDLGCFPPHRNADDENHYDVRDGAENSGKFI